MQWRMATVCPSSVVVRVYRATLSPICSLNSRVGSIACQQPLNVTKGAVTRDARPRSQQEAA